HMSTPSVPPARLLVSCRRQSDFTRFIGPIASTSNNSPTSVDLGEFSPAEFEGLLQDTSNIDSGVAKRLIDSADLMMGRSRERATFISNNAAIVEPRWI